LRAIEITPRSIGKSHEREHDRHLDQNADHGGQRRAGVQAEQADGNSDGQFEEIRGADQRSLRSRPDKLLRPTG